MKNRILVLLFLFAVGFQSCKKDDEVTETTSFTNSVSSRDHAIVKKWTELYLTIEKDLSGFRPSSTSRAIGYINMAAYETALPGMPDYVSNSKKISGLIVPQFNLDAKEINWEVALNACYYTTFKHFLIGATTSQRALINKTEYEIGVELRGKMFDDVYQNSIEWGVLVANAVIKFADSDYQGFTQSVNAFPTDYKWPIGDGFWEPAPGNTSGALFPYWGKVRSFVAKDEDLISPKPLSFSKDPNSEYYKQHLELYNMVTNITPENRHIAEFWSDDIVGLTYSPPARLLALANQMLELEKMNLEEALHFYCKLGLGINDAAVAAWGSKYTYNTERPENFIWKYIDPNFKSILGLAIGRPGLVPPFPGYPSGHSTFAGVQGGVFTEFFGPNYEFIDYSHYGRIEFASAPRNFTNWRQMAEENAYSRIPLGVHIKMDCDEGLRLGYGIAKKVAQYDLTK